MRQFQHIDPTALRAFYFAAQTLHFTRAAELAALTQSGVSQHIARLEENLGVALFVRTGRKIQLTSAGEELKNFAEDYLDRIDQLFETMGHEGTSLKGPVRYAMPASCLMTPHFSMLLRARQDFAGVDLDVKICHSEEVLEKLLGGDIDFGFVTRPISHRDVERTEFAREEYVLVGPQTEKSAVVESAAQILEMDFVKYPGMDVLFESWLEDHFSMRNPIQPRDLKIRGSINDLSAAVTMVENGVGVSIFPKHCVETQLKNRILRAFKIGAKTKTTYPIYLIRLKSLTPTARVTKVIETFMEMKKPRSE